MTKLTKPNLILCMRLSTRNVLPVFFLLFSSLAYAQQKYYISASGSDSNPGTSESRPWKSISKVNGFSFRPGDAILFKRGDRWNQELLPRSSGSPGRRITIGAYGSGNKPIISPSSGKYGINIRIKSYFLIENLHVIAPPTGSGIALRGDSRGSEIRNCLVEGNRSNNCQAGITFSTELEGKYGTSNYVNNNEVFNFFEGILGSGGMKGGGVVEKNYIRDMRPGGEDGIVAKRGNYEGLIIRYNEIKGWRDDGIDIFGGINIIVEYNRIHDVASPLNGGGNGIKAGGAKAKSENCIVRYNTVYNINSSSSGVKNGITSNGGDKLQIYGNLIYNVQGEAIAVPSASDNVVIHHNTAVSNSKEALYVAGKNVTARNNILWGGKRTLNINTAVKGSNNIFIGGANQSKYSGGNDINASATAVFSNASGRDYRLKAGSPAIDKGVKISGYNNGIARKSIKGNPDIGAYEYGGSDAPDPAPTKELRVNAGQDNSLTLPTNSLSLQAQVSGSDGAQVSYQWTKKSGPSATLQNTSSAKVDVRDMQEGTYVFAITVRANDQSASDEVRVVVNKKKEDNPPPSPTPNPPTGNNGLRYKYYEGSWSTLPSFASQPVRKRGTVANFDLGVRQREENFGIVFSGSIQINTSGTYTFYTDSDDGSRLFIDGKQIVNNDGLHASRERSGSVNLSPGRHAIEVRFFERSRNQILKVQYAGPGVSKQSIPDKVLFPDESTSTPPPPQNDPTPEPKPKPSNPAPTAGKNGLRYQYYEGRWSALPNFSSMQVIKSGTLGNFGLSPARTDRYFGFLFSGYIKVAQGGSYTFYTTSDDGSKLYINGKQIVDNDKVHPARERSGKVTLSSGYHKIEVRYFENAYGEELTVRYQGPGVSKQAIPASVLFLDRPADNARSATAEAKKETPKPKSVAAQEVESDMLVYPVPLEEQLTIDLGTNKVEQPITITLTDRIGREILHESVEPHQQRELTLYLEGVELLKGVYFVNVTTTEGTLSTFKVIKE